uniref:Uncharacterized protein n=1 Tax=Heterosigma akashiwo TaxID=2829 RepID=A0A6V1PJS4_HETAK|mmetsp:Transcript_11216/g.15762  ORF Transcript_11216/g.15762 Transcript_11216/m.15762 type:complete len:139 (+) Transcript_11216:54-470(+)
MSLQSLRHVARACTVASRAGRLSVLRGGGVGDRPFARTIAPVSKLHEEHELVWDDGVAAEACLDFDVPEVPSHKGLAWLMGGFGFFGTVMGLVSLSDPAAKCTTAPRSTVLPFNGLKVELGGQPCDTENEDDEDEEED